VHVWWKNSFLPSFLLFLSLFGYGLCFLFTMPFEHVACLHWVHASFYSRWHIFLYLFFCHAFMGHGSFLSWRTHVGLLLLFLTFFIAHIFL
jgi:hypothetical protein